MIIVPKEDIKLISSNLQEIEDGIEVFSSSKSYSLGSIVQYQKNIYESLKSNNSDTPKEGTDLSWFFKGKTNKYRAFDEYISTVTRNKEKIEYEFSVSDIDTVALFNLQSMSVRVELFNKNNIKLYDLTKETYRRVVSNWLEWTHQEPIFEKTVFFRNIPMTLNCRLKVTISYPNSFAQCGFIMYGRSLNLGMTLCDPKPTSSIRNIIAKDRDKNGVVNFTNSRLYKRVTLNVVVESYRVTEIQNILEDFTITPCLFIGAETNDDLNALTVFGYYKDFDKPIGLDYTEYQIEIEGII